MQTRCHRALYDGVVTAQPAEAFDQHDVIHLGGETAVVVPVDEYRKLRALERLAPPDELEAAEADAVLRDRQRQHLHRANANAGARISASPRSQPRQRHPMSLAGENHS